MTCSWDSCQALSGQRCPGRPTLPCPRAPHRCCPGLLGFLSMPSCWRQSCWVFLPGTLHRISAWMALLQGCAHRPQSLPTGSLCRASPRTCPLTWFAWFLSSTWGQKLEPQVVTGFCQGTCHFHPPVVPHLLGVTCCFIFLSPSPSPCGEDALKSYIFL